VHGGALNRACNAEIVLDSNRHFDDDEMTSDCGNRAAVAVGQRELPQGNHTSILDRV